MIEVHSIFSASVTWFLFRYVAVGANTLVTKRGITVITRPRSRFSTYLALLLKLLNSKRGHRPWVN
jgi:hypothetical protein